MHHARDAEDKRLLETGEHKLLLSAYFDPVRERCFLRLRDRAAGEEAAQQVFVRLLEELRRGRTYPVPYRVVVWNVVSWTARGYEWTAKEGATLPESWDAAAPDEYEEWEAKHDLGTWIGDLPDREREVLDLLHREGLSPQQVAEKLRA